MTIDNLIILKYNCIHFGQFLIFFQTKMASTRSSSKTSYKKEKNKEKQNIQPIKVCMLDFNILTERHTFYEW